MYRGTPGTPVCTGGRVVSRVVVGVTGVSPRGGVGLNPRRRRDEVSSEDISSDPGLGPTPVSSRHPCSNVSQGLI